jgi:hypothetical protein
VNRQLLLWIVVISSLSLIISSGHQFFLKSEAQNMTQNNVTMTFKYKLGNNQPEKITCDHCDSSGNCYGCVKSPLNTISAPILHRCGGKSVSCE